MIYFFIQEFNSSLPSATYMSVNSISIGSYPVWHQAITWTNAWLWLTGPLWTNFSEMWIAILNFLSLKMHLKMSAKWRPFGPGGDE